MPRLSGFLASSTRNAVFSFRGLSGSTRMKGARIRSGHKLYSTATRTFAADGKYFHSAIIPQLTNYEDEFHDTTNLLPSRRGTSDSTKGMNIFDNDIAKMMINHISTGSQDAFYVVDLRKISSRHSLWKSKLPNVKPFYAVKCNPDEKVLHLLHQLGCGFDCASKEEIDAVLRVGASSSDIIYANPCKQLSHINYSKQRFVNMMTFDSCDELLKVQQVHPSSKLVLRLLVDDSHSQCQLGSKFGAPLEQIPEILSYAKQLNLDVVGVSFHVGSGCYSTKAYSDAVFRAKLVFDIAKNKGFDMTVLDIGGGFPGHNAGPISFEEIANVLTQSLDQHFPADSGVSIIAEPGRFYVASSHTLAVNVIGRKLVSRPASCLSAKGGNSNGTRHIHASSPHYMYYVNDGVYGSFNCLLYDHAHVTPKALQGSNSDNNPGFSCSIWGPTCDGLDCISKEATLPLLNVGQWMYFEDMGAYTSAAGSCFNGFQPPLKHYFDQDGLGI